MLAERSARRRRSTPTTWPSVRPFTIIVLGEFILASVQPSRAPSPRPAPAARPAATPAPGGARRSPQLWLLIVGGLLLVFSLWWLYFKRDHADLIGQGCLIPPGLRLRPTSSCSPRSPPSVRGSPRPSTWSEGRRWPLRGRQPSRWPSRSPLYALTFSGLHAAADRNSARSGSAAAVNTASLGIALLGLDAPDHAAPRSRHRRRRSPACRRVAGPPAPRSLTQPAAAPALGGTRPRHPRRRPGGDPATSPSPDPASPPRAAR